MRFKTALRFLPVLLLCSFLHAEEESPGCKWGEGDFAKEITGYRFKVTHIAHGTSENGDCVVTVRSPSGKVLFQRVNFVISFVYQGELEGDAGPYVVFEAYEGGAHCCWRYWFVSLGTHPGRFIELYNERPATFERDKTGRTLVRTLDGAFDYFDELCHACTPFPTVILEVRGRRLIDVSSQFVSEFDGDIAKARHEFEWEEDGEEFAALQHFKPVLGSKYDEARAAALTVILAYLYSGREQQAWKALDEMWPASDRARIKKLILKTRAEGVLSQIGVAARKSGSPQAR